VLPSLKYEKNAVPCVLGMVDIPTTYFICASLTNTILNMDTRNEMCRRNEQQTHNGAPSGSGGIGRPE